MYNRRPNNSHNHTFLLSSLCPKSIWTPHPPFPAPATPNSLTPHPHPYPHPHPRPPTPPTHPNPAHIRPPPHPNPAHHRPPTHLTKCRWGSPIKANVSKVPLCGQSNISEGLFLRVHITDLSISHVMNIRWTVKWFKIVESHLWWLWNIKHRFDVTMVTKA